LLKKYNGINHNPSGSFHHLDAFDALKGIRGSCLSRSDFILPGKNLCFQRAATAEPPCSEQTLVCLSSCLAMLQVVAMGFYIG
jgi:hypothetical protein